MPSSGSDKTGRRSTGVASHRRGAFTLIELLTVTVIIIVLVALGLGTTMSATKRVRTLQCVSKMRDLGAAILLFSNEHKEMPRSMHSAASAGVDSWTYAIAPYLGIGMPLSKTDWPGNFERYYRCPEDRNVSPIRWSYGLNVFFELNPEGDDYEGSPATWRRVQSVPKPSRTILLAEPRSVNFADHIMPHLWKSNAAALNALDSKRHGTTSNYLFLDGHVETLRVEAVFIKGTDLDLFNPALAR